MTQADKIRRYALQHYVEPARAAGEVALTIRAGDICRALSLGGRAPNVCSALKSNAFLRLGELEMIERTGPHQSTTTAFRYAIRRAPADRAGTGGGRPGGSVTTRKPKPSVKHLPPSPKPTGQLDLTVVIQCAAQKQRDAGRLIGEDGKPIIFVARPDQAPRTKDVLYRRPDDVADDGRTWRAHLRDCNGRRGENSLGLLPAWQLYRPAVYGELAAAFGLENLFILSAGWGLLAANFLTPYYDITFTSQADPYKRRNARRDDFTDFRMLPDDRDGPIVFLGGKDYVALFRELTAGSTSERIIFYNSKDAPDAGDCRLVRFETSTRTNWHYECARALISGTVSIQS